MYPSCGVALQHEDAVRAPSALEFEIRPLPSRTGREPLRQSSRGSIATDVPDLVVVECAHKILEGDVVSIVAWPLLRRNHRGKLGRQHLLHERLRRRVVASVMAHLEKSRASHQRSRVVV